ncbi:MAG: hypothetical protein JKY18_12360 [Flavobacteriales bacterium]|nr:hypothetical protein [Flavobacteriales bacterium]MBL4736105.1 hypothetical protein [Flavobacteriales bacterium]PCH88255.1 MAG: hypothetical protein COB88_04295 [Flavobacteriales bacterium]
MQSALPIPKIIQKEQVSQLHFPQEDVLLSCEDNIARTIDLYYASNLGNLDRFKVKLIFEDNKMQRLVETTIWAVTEKMVVLKKGVMIPIHRVHRVKFL